eukprot:8873228-Heterocapsa_arctica.AAC.1
MGATWRAPQLAYWHMGTAADGSNVLEHAPAHEERQGALQQLHDQVLAEDEPGPHQSGAQGWRGGGSEEEVRGRIRQDGR